MDWKLELVQIPVADIDRAKTFYSEKAGFRADVDHQVTDEMRFVQLTPPGSACSIALTSGVHGMEPGSLYGFQLVVDDADAACDELRRRGVDVGDARGVPVGEIRLLRRSRRQLVVGSAAAGTPVAERAMTERQRSLPSGGAGLGGEGRRLTACRRVHGGERDDRMARREGHGPGRLRRHAER